MLFLCNTHNEAKQLIANSKPNTIAAYSRNIELKLIPNTKILIDLNGNLNTVNNKRPTITADPADAIIGIRIIDPDQSVAQCTFHYDNNILNNNNTNNTNNIIPIKHDYNNILSPIFVTPNNPLFTKNKNLKTYMSITTASIIATPITIIIEQAYFS